MSKNLKVLSVRDLAGLWGMHPHTISRGLSGQLRIDLPPAFKIGGEWRFREDDVEEHLNRLSGRSAAQTGARATNATAGVLTTTTKRKPGRPRKSAITLMRGAGA